MLVEHEWITTLEESDAQGLAQDALRGMGFVCRRDEGKLLAERGGKRAGAGVFIHELPQRATVNYDRGRMTVAVFAETPNRLKPPGKHKVGTMLRNTALRLEDELAVYPSSERITAEQWIEANRRDRLEHQARTRSRRIIVGSLIGFITLIVILLIVWAVS
ncbi:MAG: hypothetical protein AAGI68_04975 [Planctomycetota bacterium]